MPQASIKYDATPDQSSPVLREDGIESGFVGSNHEASQAMYHQLTLLLAAA